MSQGINWTVLLTGDEDNLIDLTLRVSSMTMNLRESTSSFLSLVIDPSQISDVLARPNGDIEVYKTLLPDGTPTLVKSFNQGEPRLDTGGGSRSYQLTGTTTASWTPFSTVDVQREDVVTDRLLESGLISLEVSPLLDIYPGDTIDYYENVILPPTSYEIDLVTINANAGGTQVTIREVEA